MLPLQLLRVRIKNKGRNIAPVFCQYLDNNSSELQLAAKMIKEFEESCKEKKRNGSLLERIAMLESQYDDYKLVRGFYTLLERRCVFSSKRSMVTGINNIDNNTDSISSNHAFDGNSAITTTSIAPFIIRRELFEESSKKGFALTDLERTQIMNTIASRLGVSKGNIDEDMWSDLEENMILDRFYKITPEQLIAWYNLSLMQTLLFNCTQLEFSVFGGSNWKRVLRDVKRLGLMYNLQQQLLQNESQQKYQQGDGMQDKSDVSVYGDGIRSNTILVCSVDGPLSIFKLTDRYGTSIAKLLPSIISAEAWTIKAWIVRKTLSYGKKMYEFQISNEESPTLIREPYRDIGKKNSDRKEDFSNFNPTFGSVYYDSGVEEKFATKFEQSANGWKLIREPDPLIVSNGKALIPDFMFEKYGRRIYLEIVGFWTKEYLNKKLQKITDISTRSNDNKIDFFIAVNKDYYTSPNSHNNKEKLNSSKIFAFTDNNHLILYKNDNVPLNPILEYLKSIDVEMVENFATHNYKELLTDLDRSIVNNATNGIIAINEIAKKYNIPVESALRIIRSEEQKAKKNNDDIKYIIAGTYLIFKSKAKELELFLRTISKFNEACLLFAKYDIPESCHIDLICKLGFDIIWKGIDYNSAIIERKKT